MQRNATQKFLRKLFVAVYANALYQSENIPAATFSFGEASKPELTQTHKDRLDSSRAL